MKGEYIVVEQKQYIPGLPYNKYPKILKHALAQSFKDHAHTFMFSNFKAVDPNIKPVLELGLFTWFLFSMPN